MGNPTGKKGGGGGDMMLESRHLIGMFFGLVILCSVFFVLGYGVGKTQFDTTVRAASVGKPPESSPAAPAVDPVKPAEKPPVSVPAPGDWTFPTAAAGSKPSDRLEPAPPKPSSRGGDMKVELNHAPVQPSAAKPAPIAPSKVASRMHAPAIPKGASVLQVAALSKEADALALAEALQRKNFSAFVLQPMGDNLYRVQVGPYADAASADAGKKALFREGFKAILKK